MSVALQAIAAARSWIGTPYRHRSATRGAGADCLGLVRGVWRDLYGSEPYEVPAYSADPRRDGDPYALERAARAWLVFHEGAPRPGDVILFALRRNHPPRHCAILLDETRFVHAQERLGVVTAPLSPAWQKRFAGAFAFPLSPISD